MADNVRSIEELIADINILNGALHHARGLLNVARRKRDQMRADGDAETDVNTEITTQLNDVKDVVDNVASSLTNLNFANQIVVRPNKERGINWIKFSKSAIPHGGVASSTISTPGGSNGLQLFSHSDKLQVRGSDGADGFYTVSTVFGNDSIQVIPNFPVDPETDIESVGRVEVVLIRR